MSAEVDTGEPRARVNTAAVEAAARRRQSFYRELPFLIVVAVVLALLIKTLLIQAFYIPSGSMQQTLEINDRVLVNKLVYRFRPINRGEIVVFEGPHNGRWVSESQVPPPKNAFDATMRKVSGALGLGHPGEKDFIKRVVGIPGDTVACCSRNRIVVNGQEVDEPYLYFTNGDPNQTPFEATTVPEGQLYVLGDHRDSSSDSRYSGFVPIENVVGRAFVILWPPRHAKPLRVPDVWDPRSDSQAVRQAGPWSLAVTPPALGLVIAVPVTLLRRRRRS